ncbi:MBL fold metallo-hydrolase [Stackebrandtia soli]|uniref:MBL fold metallo-hydrolase n=1 Tax=Stackebrandtia soli TaxID=1892856 RepID=UPI0039EB7066
MLIESLVAEAFATNCYVVAAEAGSDCVVIDPGIGIAERLNAFLAARDLTPVAVMMTHGHLDHTFSVTPIADPRGIPAYVHPGDAGQLVDPLAGLGDLGRMFAGKFDWREPNEIASVVDGQKLELAGLTFTITHAPGHTPGSVLFGLDGDDDAESYSFTGDVLFKGTIGRTDLPGGDSAQMMASLRDKVLALPDGTVVLPGHGDRTDIGVERRTNPFLIELSNEGHTQAPTRGL